MISIFLIGCLFGFFFGLCWIVYRFSGMGQEKALNSGLNGWIEKWVDSHTEQELINFVNGRG